MAQEYPYNFAPVTALQRQTQLYTQRLSNASSPAEYRMTLEQLANFLITEFSLATAALPSTAKATVGGRSWLPGITLPNPSTYTEAQLDAIIDLYAGKERLFYNTDYTINHTTQRVLFNRTVRDSLCFIKILNV